ncbi:MAG: GNAT family protein [Candidatus Limnocylindrales bacterium]
MVRGEGSLPPIHRHRVALVGARVRLRPADAADHARFVEILTERTVHPWWQAADPDVDARELTGRDDEVVVWAVEVEGRVVGIIEAHEETDPRYRHAGIDIVLVSEAQDRGLGSDAVRTVARWLIEERGHHRLTIDPAASNARAIAAYAKVGFKPVGVMRQYEGDLDGTWHDGLLMDLLAAELTDG